MKKIFLLCFLLLCLCSGCGKTDDKVAADAVTVVLSAEPASLDPALTTGLAESHVELELFEGLTRLDENCLPQPALAESWSISPDGKIYTFHLRPGLLWSDGTPLTAEDFAFAWKRVLAPETGSENAYMLYLLENGEKYNNEEASAESVGVHALDDHTLQVRLRDPAAYFLGLTAFHGLYPVPHKLVQAKPESWASNAAGLVGCGPYTIATWTHSSEIVLHRNPSYWNKDVVKSSELRFPISDSQSTNLTMVESGLAQMMYEPPTADQNRLEKNGLYHTVPSLSTYYYVFNTQKPPFDDIRVRRAFALSVQRENMIKYIVRSHKQAAYAFVPPGMLEDGEDFRATGGPLIQEDVPQARAELASLTSPLPEITLLYNTGELNKAIAEAVQAMWQKNLDVTVELANQEKKVFFASCLAGEYQVACASWVADFADPMNYLEVFYDPENDAFYHDAAFKALVRRAQQETDRAARRSLMHQAEKKLLDDYVIIPIYFGTQPFAALPELQGYFWTPLGTVDLSRAYREVK